MNRSWIYAFCGWLLCLISVVWILSSPFALTLSKQIAAEVHVVTPLEDEDPLRDNLYLFLQKWIRGIGVIAALGSLSGSLCFFYFYQRRERIVQLLFKDLQGSFSYSNETLTPKKVPRSLFSLPVKYYSDATESEKRLDEIKTLLGALEEGVLIINENGCIEQANQKALFVLNILSGEVLGKSFAGVLALHKTSLGERCLDLVTTAHEQHQEIRDHYEGQGDDKRFYELIAIPLQKQNKILLLIQDHSSDHKMLTMGKNFVTNASHELRTPITIIEGFTETLQEMPEISREMFQEITDKILKSCHRMTSVVKSLLVLADLDYSGKATLQPCDLVVLIESCCYTLLSSHPKVKIETLFNEKESMVLGDPDLLELAIMNLFENAVKYSPEPAFITVTVETLPDKVNLSIRDRGIGIALTDMQHIFERFYTVNKSRSRKLGGAGLGLSIVKMIMEKHHASISVASPGKEGTTFTMQFQKWKVHEEVTT